MKNVQGVRGAVQRIKEAHYGLKPEIEKRIDAGAKIVKTCLIESASFGFEKVVVGDYKVSRDGKIPNDWRCSCHDYTLRHVTSNVYGPVCKHIFAAIIALSLPEEPEEPEEPGENIYRAAKDGTLFEYFARKLKKSTVHRFLADNNINFYEGIAHLIYQEFPESENIEFSIYESNELCEFFA